MSENLEEQRMARDKEYADLKKEMNEVASVLAEFREKHRASCIAQIQEMMTEYGISIDDLDGQRAENLPKKRGPKPGSKQKNKKTSSTNEQAVPSDSSQPEQSE